MNLNNIPKLNEIFKLNFKARHAGIAALTNIAVLVVLVIVNLLVQKIPADWDMTKRKLFSLTEDSIQLITNLDQEVVIYMLAKPGMESADILEVLKKYDNASKKIRLEVIDPDRNPTLINRYAEDGQDVAQGSLIIVSGQNSRIIDRMDLYSISYNQQGAPQVVGMTVEQRVTAAFSYVTTGREPKVYVLEGHNEYTLEELNLIDPVKKANYSSEPLNLIKAGKVPDDADILLILSPERDLNDMEAYALNDYLSRGGAVFIGMDLMGEIFPNFSSLLASYNVRIEQGVIMEKDTNRLLPGLGNNPIFFSPRYPEENAITTPLRENNLDVFLVTAMGIGETEVQKRNLNVEPLLSSSNNSWLRTDMQERSESRVGSDIPGPVHAAVSIAEQNRDTGEEDGARLIVLASGQSLSRLSGLGQIKANIEFFLNSLNWLSAQEETVSISSKSVFRLPLRINALQAWIYAGVSILLIPLLIIIVGTVVNLRRKHL